MTNAEDAWLSVEEVAKRWGFSKAYVRRVIKEGALKASVIAGGPARKHYRVRASEVDRYEQENMT